MCTYDSICTIEGCTIQGNSTSSDGGGVYCRERSNVTISKCSFDDNSSGDEGGGVYCYYGAVVSITNCTFTNNRSEYRGGAVGTYESGPTITNCTFSGNQTANYGGAISFRYGPSPVVANCVFVNNTKHAIYRYYSDDYPTVTNCLFYGNIDGDYFDSYYYESFNGPSRINSLPGAFNNITGDPMFAFENDCHIMTGSTCIDRGDNNPSGGLPETDKDGNPRSLAGSVFGAEIADIGAYEYNRQASSIALSVESLEFIKEIDGLNPADQTLQIRNCGGGALNWQIEENCNWLSVTPAAGQSTSEVSQVILSIDTMRMSRGVYTTELIVSDSLAANSPRSIWVTLRIKGRLLVPQQYATISQAITASMDGETIDVSSGVYAERLVVDKQLEIRGLDMPVIDTSGIGGYAVSLTADMCILEGFHIKGGSTGVVVQSLSNTISNNIISENQTGVQLYSGSGDNMLSENEILDNQQWGLRINYSPGNELSDNAISGSNVNFDITGSTQEQYDQDIDITNTVDGKPIYYIVNSDDVYIDPSSNAGCVVAVGCTDIIIEGLTLSNNAFGVLFAYTHYSLVEDTVLTNNSTAGVMLFNSTNNGITENTISNNGYGILLSASGDNFLRDNTCTDNDYNFGCEGAPEDYQQEADTSNTFDGKPLYYLVDQVGVTVGADSNAACVYAVSCRNITVCDLELSGNGAGVAFVDTSNSTVDNITSMRNEMAGIYVFSSKKITLTRNNVCENPIGIYVEDSDQCVISRDVIYGNQQGVYCYYSDLAIVNSIVRHNSPQGGIYVYSYDQRNMTVQNCTIFGNVRENSYPYGGGIACDYAYPYVKLTNCILWANSPEQVYYDYYFDIRYCNIQGGLQNTEGEGIIDEPPMLTPDGHLCLGSPCINMGDPVPRYSGTDFDGEARVSDWKVDIGADEYTDGDSDGLPDCFEKTYFDPNGISAEPDDDPDGDDYSNLNEYEWYSSDPTLACMKYYVDSARPDDSNDGLSWETARKTISAAILEAENSDRIVVAPGYYGENINPQGRQVVIEGKDAGDELTVASTIVGGGVNLIQGEMRGFTISGLTISNQYGPGILCQGTSPTIRDCVLMANRSYSSQQGGGIHCDSASPLIIDCIISGNTSYYRGSAIYAQNSRIKASNCLMAGNIGRYSGDYGMAIYLSGSDLTIDKCTIADTYYPEGSSSSGSAILCEQSNLRMSNSILWNKLNQQIVADNSSTILLNYSDVMNGAQGIDGNWSGTGNIAVDPCFANVGYWTRPPNYSNAYWVDGDYHLRSAGWRWTRDMSHGSHWVWDGQTSHCIDAGNPGTPLGDEVMIVPSDPDFVWGRNTRVNMGAYCGKVEASMPPHGWSVLGDVSNDGMLDFADYARCMKAQPSELMDCPADLDRNGIVNTLDIVLMSGCWLEQTDWCGTVVPFEREVIATEEPIPDSGTSGGGVTGGVIVR